jgi:hypothetical protein
MNGDVLHPILVFEALDKRVRLFAEQLKLALLHEARIAGELDDDIDQRRPNPRVRSRSSVPVTMVCAS